MAEKNGYRFSRQWFDFAFENPDRASTAHATIYFWLIELNNRLGWKERFGVPTYHSMEACSIRSYKTFQKCFQDLVEWGFLVLHQKATNNHTANIIELVIFTDSITDSLTKSITNCVPTELQTQDILTDQVSAVINKPINHKPKNYKPTNDNLALFTKINIPFEDFWNLYDKKVGEKQKLEKKWNNLSDLDRTAIMQYIPAYKQSVPEKQYRKNPETFLNNRGWEDEIINKTPLAGGEKTYNSKTNGTADYKGSSYPREHAESSY